MTGLSRFRRPDPTVVGICGAAGLVMAALTLGAVDPRIGFKVALLFVAWGLAPYALTVAASCFAAPQPFVSLTTRTVAVVYAVFDNFIRYLALYHPTGSTDAIVVAVLPLWWVVCMAATASAFAVTLAAWRWFHARRIVT